MEETDRKVSCENLVNALAALPKRTPFNYIHGATHTLVAIDDVETPYGPITIRRWDPDKGETSNSAKVSTISKEMMFRFANAITEGLPVNVDRVFGASYNTRSALESLICHTPQFYYCYPGRIENKNGVTKIVKGHKHIIWFPDEPHQKGVLVEKQLENMEINEIPSKNVIYNALEIPAHMRETTKAKQEEQRMHLMMQMAVFEIGKAFGFNTYIAKNDSGMKYRGKPLLDYENIIKDLTDVPTVAPFAGAAHAGRLIDCIWFGNKTIPAVMEVDNATGVTSGLTRMQNFKGHLPEYKGMRFIIIAPDELRDKVIFESNKPQFAELHTTFLPYSTVGEILGFCQEHRVKGITGDFIDTFLEEVCIK